jgi:DNA-binding IclR family transcriptional regulator
VDSARKVLQLLLQFSEERPEATVEQLAQAVSASVSSTYRYVALLREVGLVEERHRGTYSLSPRVLALARGAEAASSIVGIARPVLDRLTDACGEAAFLVQQMGDSAVCVDLSQSDHPVRLSFAPGKILSLHRGAAPKVLLASLDSKKIRAYFKRLELAASDPQWQLLEAELEEIRAKGWGESSAEVDEGVWAVAAPICVAGSVVAAVSVAAPGYRVDTEQRDRIRALVRDAAREVSDAITPRRL